MPGPPQAGLRILVVDDDRDVAVSLAEYLELDGHHVDMAFSGRDGADAGIREHYDRIIIDVGLPDLDGMRVMTEIRAARPGARILLISGHSGVQLEQKGAIREGVAVLTKPVSPEHLADHLASDPT